MTTKLRPGRFKLLKSAWALTRAGWDRAAEEISEAAWHIRANSSPIATAIFLIVLAIEIACFIPLYVALNAAFPPLWVIPIEEAIILGALIGTTGTFNRLTRQSRPQNRLPVSHGSPRTSKTTQNEDSQLPWTSTHHALDKSLREKSSSSMASLDS